MKLLLQLHLSLTHFVRIPLVIMGIFPMLTVLISFQRAILVYAKRTKRITLATVTEFCGIIIVHFIAVKLFSLVGVISATVGFVIGRISANIYQAKPVINSIKKYSPESN